MQVEETFTHEFYEYLSPSKSLNSLGSAQKAPCSLQRTGIFRPDKGDDYSLQFNLLCIDRIKKIVPRIPGSSNRVDISLLYTTKKRCLIAGLVSTRNRSRRTRDSKYLDLESPESKARGRQPQEELNRSQKESIKWFTIEDETGHVRVILHENIKHLRSLIVGVTGALGSFSVDQDRFICEELVLPMPLPQSYILKEPDKLFCNNKHFFENVTPNSSCVLLVSEMSELRDYNHLVSAINHLSRNHNTSLAFSRINSVIIVGGPQINLTARDQQIDERNLKNQQLITRNAINDLRLFNQALAQILTFSDVFLIPSATDIPPNNVLPQPPMDRGLLSNANLCNPRLKRCSNPQLFKYPHQSQSSRARLEKNHQKKNQSGGPEKFVTILGSCGTNVRSMQIECSIEDPIDAMHHQLALNHIAPTSPEALKLVPSKSDHFVLDTLPHVYFSGGSEYKARNYFVAGSVHNQWCLTMVLPPFRRGVVLLNTTDLTHAYIQLS